jgi:hypothetical protein
MRQISVYAVGIAMAIVLSFTAFAATEKKSPDAEYLPKNVQPNPSETKHGSPAKVLPTNNFASETLAAEPVSLTPAVGYWLIGLDDEKKVLVVDGRKWEEGNAAGGIAEKAKAIYGERYAEFLDGVKKFAYFPFAVANYVDDFNKGEISVRFKPVSGSVDQAGGIIFNVKPNGDYLILRANALEENLVLFKYVKGKRSSVKWVKNVPTPTKQWHDLKLTVAGKEISGFLDGKKYLDFTLPEPVSGKVGLWSKADSVTYFTDFTVKTN